MRVFFALVLYYKFILKIIRGVSNKAVEGKKLAPFCNFRGPFFKKGGPRKGFPQKVFELIGTDCSMRKRTFIEIIIYRLASTEHEVIWTLMLNVNESFFKKKKKNLSLGLFFFARHLTRQRKFYVAFFSKLRKSRKAAI